MLHIIQTHIGLYIHNDIKCATMSTEFLQTRSQSITLLHILDDETNINQKTSLPCEGKRLNKRTRWRARGDGSRHSQLGQIYLLYTFPASARLAQQHVQPGRQTFYITPVEQSATAVNSMTSFSIGELVISTSQNWKHLNKSLNRPQDDLQVDSGGCSYNKSINSNSYEHPAEQGSNDI